MKTIDLKQYHEVGTIVLSGRPKGEKLRAALNLDKLDEGEEQVQVVVPREVISLNSSFFSGLFGPSVRSKGEDAFRAKYSFSCLPAIQEDIESGIRDALKTSNPLGRPVLK